MTDKSFESAGDRWFPPPTPPPTTPPTPTPTPPTPPHPTAEGQKCRKQLSMSYHVVLMFPGPWHRLCLPPPCSVASVPNSTWEPRLVHGLKRHMDWGGASRPFARCLHWCLPLVFAGWYPMAGNLHITLEPYRRRGALNHRHFDCFITVCSF